MKIKTNEYDSLHDICNDYKEIIDTLENKFIDSEGCVKDELMDFNSNDESFRTVLGDSITKINKPSSVLKSGVQLKNKMLDGGYHSGRFYLYLGLPGGFKSGELLNLALDFKKYNKSIIKEMDKTPVILFVTQENSIRETIERIWGYYNGDDSEKELKNYSVEEAFEALKEFGFSDGIPIMMKYRKSKSISTKDVEKMIQKINGDGEHHVICVIHDYLKRIRSTEKFDSLYEELGAVCDEFCNMAKYFDIPVISASQFNRDGYLKIEEAIKKSKSDPLKDLTTSNIGESVRLVDNSDYIISVHRKPDPVTGELMIAYNLLKQRGKPPKDAVTYFAQPFEEGNTMKIKSDIGLAKSLSKLELGDGTQQLSVSQHRKKLKEKLNTKTSTTKSSNATSKGRLRQMELLEEDDED
jgi:replicative DNA helicase